VCKVCLWLDIFNPSAYLLGCFEALGLGPPASHLRIYLENSNLLLGLPRQFGSRNLWMVLNNATAPSTNERGATDDLLYWTKSS
jgi:hypothetical protein